MKNDKSDKTPATSATSATQETGLTGLLGGSIDTNDPLALVGLGVGATQRAKDLVLLGLEYEKQLLLKGFCESEITRLDADSAVLAEKIAELDEFLGAGASGRGRPRKGWLTLDVKRAAAVIDAADWYFQRFQTKVETQERAIEIAQKIDKILVETGIREEGLFLAAIPAIRNSVSKGLKELPEEKGRFIAK